MSPADHVVIEMQPEPVMPFIHRREPETRVPKLIQRFPHESGARPAHDPAIRCPALWRDRAIRRDILTG